MDYTEAKEVIRNYFSGIAQPVVALVEALETISEKDYEEIQAQTKNSSDKIWSVLLLREWCNESN